MKHLERQREQRLVDGGQALDGLSVLIDASTKKRLGELAQTLREARRTSGAEQLGMQLFSRSKFGYSNSFGSPPPPAADPAGGCGRSHTLCPEVSKALSGVMIIAEQKKRLEETIKVRHLSLALIQNQ